MFNIVIKQNPDGSISLACDRPEMSAKQMMTVLQNMVFELQERILLEKIEGERRIKPARAGEVLQFGKGGKNV